MHCIIYGKPGCKFCEQAKILCHERGVPFEYRTLERDYTREQLTEITEGKFKTFPQVFIMEDGMAEYVGGFDELKQKI